MAITSGVGPHSAFVTVNGATFPVEHGRVERHGTRKSSNFLGVIPLNYPGADDAFANLGDNEAVITVTTRGVEAPLVTGELDTTAYDYIGGTIKFAGRDKSAKLHNTKTSANISRAWSERSSKARITRMP
jgi:hypothetical protein